MYDPETTGATVSHSRVVCMIAVMGPPKNLKVRTDFDRDEAMAVGERMINMQRVIALKRGFKPAVTPLV